MPCRRLVLLKALQSNNACSDLSDVTDNIEFSYDDPQGDDIPAEQQWILNQDLNRNGSSETKLSCTIAGHRISLALLTLPAGINDALLASGKHVFELARWAKPEVSRLDSRAVLTLLCRVISAKLSGHSLLIAQVELGNPLIKTALDFGFKIIGSTRSKKLFSPERLVGHWPVGAVMDCALPPALIIGRASPNMLGQARALGRCGVPVACLITRGESPLIMRVSRYVRDVVDGRHSPDKTIIKHIHDLADSNRIRPVIFCSGDRDIELTARIWQQISHRVTAASDPIVAKALNNKMKQLDKISISGIAAPKSRRLSSAQDIDEAKVLLNYPVVCRPVELAKRGDFTHNVAVYQSPIELDENARTALEKGRTELLIQEYIPGGDETLFFSLAACDRNGKPLAMVTGRKLVQYPDGLMCVGETVSRPELEDLARASFLALKVGGVLGVEFKQDARDGAYYYIEANLRPESIIAIAERATVNIMLLAYLNAIGRADVYDPCLTIATRWRDTSQLILGRLSRRLPLKPGRANDRETRWVDALLVLDDSLPAMVWYGHRFWTRAVRLLGR